MNGEPGQSRRVAGGGVQSPASFARRLLTASHGYREFVSSAVGVQRTRGWALSATRHAAFWGVDMTREEFRARWNSRLTECVRLGILVDGERFCHEVLADFDAVIRAEDDRLLSLADASEASGYCADHLRRLYRQGVLPGERRGRRIFFRSADLPKKPESERMQSFGRYDPVADARQVMARLSRPPEPRHRRVES